MIVEVVSDVSDAADGALPGVVVAAVAGQRWGWLGARCHRCGWERGRTSSSTARWYRSSTACGG